MKLPHMIVKSANGCIHVLWIHIVENHNEHTNKTGAYSIYIKYQDCILQLGHIKKGYHWWFSNPSGKKSCMECIEFTQELHTTYYTKYDI